MDHGYLEEHQVVDRYLMGKLTPEELARFEEHYLGCAECLDRLEATADLARALKRAASEDAARSIATRQLAAVAWLARLGRSRQAAVLVVGLLLLLLVPSLALFRAGQAGRELRTSRAAQAAAGTRERAERAASRAELAREQAEHAKAMQDLARAREPQPNLPILYLGAERGAEHGGEPTYRLRLPARPGWVAIAVPLDPPHYASYRVVLAAIGAVGAGGRREIWHGDAAGSDQETLTLGVPSTLLAPGDHLLTLSGIAPDGRGVPAGRFTFRVLAAARPGP